MSDPDDSRARVRTELARRCLRQRGVLTIRVAGSSMLPALRPGDYLTLRRCAIGDLQVGEIAACFRGDRLSIHRVVATSRTHVLTRGDAVGAADPPATENECLGKVIAVHRAGRLLPMPIRRGLGTRVAAAVFQRSALARRCLALASPAPASSP